jgi:hypothetical protein
LEGDMGEYLLINNILDAELLWFWENEVNAEENPQDSNSSNMNNE